MLAERGPALDTSHEKVLAKIALDIQTTCEQLPRGSAHKLEQFKEGRTLVVQPVELQKTRERRIEKTAEYVR